MIALDVKSPPVTVYRYLTQFLHLKYKVTRWLPHKFSDQNLKDRVQKSNELFDILETSKSYEYRNIITEDQSRKLYQYSPHGKWCLDTEEKPGFEKDLITHQKFMLIKILGYEGFLMLICYLMACLITVLTLFQIFFMFWENRNNIFGQKMAGEKCGSVLIIVRSIILR